MALGSAWAQNFAPQALMPRVDDYALMWWAEGFPGHAPEAPWLRVVQTGRYAFALDTRTLRLPHFGAVATGEGYAACVASDNRAWQALPPAELALAITANGKAYRCTAGGKWTAFTGPRLIESGRCMQRADVTDLTFESADGERLNAEARFETAAWPDRLGLILAVRPGLQPIPAGEACFGRVGGGFGFDGTNHLEVPLTAAMDPERFTLELWAYVPEDYQVSGRTPPWLVCKGPHEQAEGNYGITLSGGRAQARLNVGGGREGALSVEAQAGLLKIAAWNHFALSYDGSTLRFYVNGALAGEHAAGRARRPVAGGLAFGRRQDNCGDGYHFRGAIDEIRLYDRALTAAEVRARRARPEEPLAGALFARSFQADGAAAERQPRERWKGAALELELRAGRQAWRASEAWKSGPEDEWQEAALALGANEIEAATARGAGAALKRLFCSESAPLPPVEVRASAWTNGAALPVDRDAARGWLRVDLDGTQPVVPPGDDPKARNNALDRVRLTLTNPADREQPARLLFSKRAGVSITGVSAVLRNAAGHPTGIPVQLSKNWHGRAEGGVYAGQWFHGFSLVRLPPRATVELELTLAYAHWGGVAAASHAQLCLIGWGSNQLWDQSALGSWGESICFEPDRAQALAQITDVRPVMVRSMNANSQWGWTHNVGGGDFFRLFGSDGKRIMPGRMKTAYLRQGPCLTEVLYAGRLGDGIEHAATVSLGRTDDLVRGVYRLRLDVRKPVDFSRFVLFQIGADTYSYTGERKMAVGNEAGLVKEWQTQWGGDTNKAGPYACAGRVPWVSLHEAVSRADRKSKAKGKPEPEGAWANRGVVIRAWRARLGGREAAPWVAEHGVSARSADTSTADFVPPPGVTRLEPGDFVEATFEHVIVPQHANDYYGPNEALREALLKDADTWRMILREAAGNERRTSATKGTLVRTFPSVQVRASKDEAAFTLSGGLGYVPVTFEDLSSPDGYVLRIDGKPVDQSVHGSDFWQADYDGASKHWSLTYTVPAGAGTHTFELSR
jgi:hypothetical protein